jgi:hypothetical protein
MICHVVSFSKKNGVGVAVRAADLSNPARSSYFNFFSKKEVLPNTSYSFCFKHFFVGETPIQLELDYAYHRSN